MYRTSNKRWFTNNAYQAQEKIQVEKSAGKDMQGLYTW